MDDPRRRTFTDALRSGQATRWLVAFVAGLLLIAALLGTAVLAGGLGGRGDGTGGVEGTPSASSTPSSPDLATPTASPLLSSGPSRSPPESAIPSATPTPLPTVPVTTHSSQPTASPPLVADGTWATVAIDGIPVRDRPHGANIGFIYLDTPVFAGAAVESGGVTWYPVVAQGFGGWVAAGSAATPSLVPFGDGHLTWHGRIMQPTVSADPLTDLRFEPSVNVAGLVLDSDLFHPAMLGALNVAWASGDGQVVELNIVDSRTVAAKTSVFSGLCGGRGELGGSGQLSLRFDDLEVSPDEPVQDVSLYLHDAMLGFSHQQATAALPNIAQALLLSYYGNDGSTCIQAYATGDRESTTVAMRMITNDCLTVLSATDATVVLADDEDPDPGFAQTFTVVDGDQVDPGVVAGATLGLRVYTDSGWRGPDLVISLDSGACG